MELTAQVLSDLYSQIENKSNNEIMNLINRSLTADKSSNKSVNLDSNPAAYRDRLSKPSATISFTGRNNQNNTFDSLYNLCIEYAALFSSQIKDIMRSNPQTTNFILNIIQLMAPAIAQSRKGITAMAIVGAITLLCRQGIENYIR